MSAFLISSFFEQNNPRIAGRLAELFPDDHYEYKDGVWVVSAKGTAKMLYDKLLPDESILDPAAGLIVLRVNSYWGLATEELWDFLSTATKKGEPSHIA